MLRDAGIEVELGVRAEVCGQLVLGFQRVVCAGGLPEVTCKAAISADGRIATASGESQWITGVAARAHGHRLRAGHDAILVGIETVLADDPRLTCRAPGGQDPVPVVLDSRFRLPAAARLLRGKRRPMVMVGEQAPSRDVGADMVRVGTGAGGLDLVEALRVLGERGMHRVLVEGGGRVHRSLLDAGLVDTVYLYVAPLLVPGGRPWVGGPPIEGLAEATRLGRPEMQRLGDDVLLVFRATGGA